MFPTVFLCSANYNTLIPQSAASETSAKNNWEALRFKPRAAGSVA